MARAKTLTLAPAALAALTLACSVSPPTDSALGYAYAGPPKLALHGDIDSKSPVTAIVHHGDKLEILTHRRRWYKVRGPKGAQGWTDDRALLDAAQMNRLRALAKETAGLPSQGVATTFETLKVRTEPNLQAISFLEVKEGEKFDVIAHKVIGRGPLPKRELIAPKPKIEKKSKAKGKASSLPPPPDPVPPGPPKDWVAISKARTLVPDDQLTPAAKDDWTLIRTKEGESGWALTRRLYLAIPDEVAQYAEGHRITSYFSLGKISDGDLKKDIWLWTTATSLGEDHDFDGYRVFVWSLNHHRYETAYIQRREIGFFPVLAKQGEFSVCLEDDNGTRVRKMYTMLGNRVMPAGQRACEKTFDPGDDSTVPAGTNIDVKDGPAKKGVFDSVKTKVKSWVGK